ncbi:MAG TPA: serine/threonine-protein kinase [Bryobacteraceae bacterium]|jgi:serine/threonine-protein kinase|nr:serine/threonine-protein kinase [Bryobacteraceae bacterium]
MDYCPRDATPLPPPLNATQFNISAGLSQRYRILRRIGEGGMGTVFLAEQLGVGNRPVALKVLHHKLLEDPDFLQRFRDEASSTGRIRHQNVVTVYECAQADDGSPYIAMEYLDGESLRQALKRRGSLPLSEAVEILQQAARGLNAAHKLGIVHRDLKPDNIFLTHDDDGQMLVKIVDFGIAKMRESMSHTMTGLAVGTPAYMSVEQASGMRSEELDGRSDIYSLGIVAYEMITGRVPFRADTPLGYLKKHLIEPPTSMTLSRPDLHISPQVDQAVMKALQKERTDRYPTAPEFARALANTVTPKSADLPETEYAIPNAGPMPPGDLSMPLAPISQPPLPVKVQTVTLAPRKSSRFGLAAAAVAVVLVAGAAIAWYMLSAGQGATRPQNPESHPPSATASSTATNSTVAPVRPDRSSASHAASEPAPKPKAALADPASQAPPDLGRAQELIKEGRFSQALPMIQRSAASGSPEGQRFMGDAYMQGWGVPKDYLRAYQWYEKSAAGGNTLAMIRIGTMYVQGWGVPQDYARARQWFEKSSAAGNALAMVRIGDLYERGWGIPKDYTQALLWYEKSAAEGNALAMLRLGNLYERGWGVPRDLRRARQWFRKSAEAGNASARERMDALPH